LNAIYYNQLNNEFVVNKTINNIFNNNVQRVQTYSQWLDINYKF